MEPSRFDELTKALATATSRRQALKTLAATTVGGIIGLGGIGTAFAAPKPPKKCHNNGLGCARNDQCCSGFCDQTTGTCACQPGICSDACPCPSGKVCLGNGSCATPCTGFCGPCGFLCIEDASTAFYCSNDVTSFQNCTSDSDCPRGQFCASGSPHNICVEFCPGI